MDRVVRRISPGIKARLESGLALSRENRLGEAETAYRSVIAEDPENPDAHNLLGLLLKQRGDLPSAVECARRAVALDPQRPGLRSNLGGMLSDLGDYAGAEEAYGITARMQPGSAVAIFNHCVALNRMRRYDEAEIEIRKALRLNGDLVPGWTLLSGVLSSLGRFAEAEEAANHAIALQADNPEAWINLGRALLEQGSLESAEKANHRALQLAPGQAQAAYNLGCALQYQARCEEAVEVFRLATDIDPGHQQAWSNRLMVALYGSGETERSIFATARLWARQTAKLQPGREPFFARPDPGTVGRRLRIGYVSPDFRSHSCASFLMPLFAAHDASAVEIFAYAKVQAADEVTQWFREHVDHWRDIFPLTDAAAAELIRQDCIDILVDLAGHTSGSPIGLFRYRPAPVQVSWLGYPATTGVEQIDYRLTDVIADPVGQADTFHVEKLIRMDGGFLCYAPRYEAPAKLPSVHSTASPRSRRRSSKRGRGCCRQFRGRA